VGDMTGRGPLAAPGRPSQCNVHCWVGVPEHV
jgi:hypothetical protein